MIYNPELPVNQKKCPNSSCNFNNATNRETCEKCGRQLYTVAKK